MRIGDAIFGVFFVALAVVVLLVAWEATPWGAFLVALVLGLLGADAVFSAMRDKRSLLTRLGPLP